jgi:sporulation protein YlmC with PRC-barrel domain
MKKLFGTTALVLSLAIPAVAQDATSPYLAGLERGVRASDFIGKRVYVTEADTTGLSDTALAQANADWEDAGEISDIIISMAGDNEAVLVDFGGFLGIGEKTVAVSMASLTMVPDTASPDDYFLVFQGNKAALESAPVFDENMVFDATVAAQDGMTDTSTTATDTTATDTTATDTIATDTTATDTTATDTTATDTTATDTTATDTTMAPVQEAGTAMGDGEMVDYGTMSETDLIGKRVYGPNGEDVGEISAVAIGADNKITAAVVDVGGFLGMGEKPVALTSDMLRFVKDPNSDEAVFTVTATQEQLEAMPNYAN